MKIAVAVALFWLGGCILAPAQNPMAEGQKFLHEMVKSNILRSAEKMPEENYSFKPTPEVRSFGQLLGHIADVQYLFCSAVLGKPNPAPGIEKSRTSKQDLIQSEFAVCSSPIDGGIAFSDLT